MNLVLASASPRRAALLDQLGLDYVVAPADIDETIRPDETAPGYVERLAREKAQTMAGPSSLIVAADTTVVYGGRILGKPGHPQEARSMLRRLAGKRHEVFTGMAVAANGDVVSLVDVTEVRMLEMTDDEIADYVASGEPMDKAGAYALQGRGGVFVESVSGSPFTVIGLPIHLLPRLVSRFGSELDEFRKVPNL